MNAYDDLTPGAHQMLADYSELDLAEVAAAQGEAIERIRRLHDETTYRGIAICGHCSAWYGPVDYPCETIQALAIPAPTAPEAWDLSQTCTHFSGHGWGRCVKPRDHKDGHSYRPPTGTRSQS